MVNYAFIITTVWYECRDTTDVGSNKAEIS